MEASVWKKYFQSSVYIVGWFQRNCPEKSSSWFNLDCACLSVYKYLWRNFVWTKRDFLNYTHEMF